MYYSFAKRKYIFLLFPMLLDLIYFKFIVIVEILIQFKNGSLLSYYGYYYYLIYYYVKNNWLTLNYKLIITYTFSLSMMKISYFLTI